MRKHKSLLSHMTEGKRFHNPVLLHTCCSKPEEYIVAFLCKKYVSALNGKGQVGSGGGKCKR